MSDTGDSGDEQAGRVGYKRPPAEHRFQKGRSGNPKGRPKKNKPPIQPEDTVLRHYIGDVVMQEALRPIQVRENDQVVELPLIQAVIRSLGVAAVKGSHRAQIALAGMVQAIQEKTIEDRLSLYKTVVEYKEAWEEEFRACDARGEPRPDPTPHPHEIRIDRRTMDITYNGPESADEKARWDKLFARRRDALEEIEELRKLKKSEDSANIQRFLDEDIAHQQRIADRIEDLFPDEKTRREPDFDLKKWRQRKEAFREIKNRRKLGGK